MTAPAEPAQVDVCIVGGGQSGLAVAYQLQRHVRQRAGRAGGIGMVLLDDRPGPGAAWLDMWESLHLFSPASHSSLPGWPMPTSPRGDDVNGVPSAADVTKYLRAYEIRYDLPVERPVAVRAVERSGTRLKVTASDGRSWLACWVVNTTGTWRRPFWPRPPGIELNRSLQLHAADYRSAAAFADRRVLVVGGGNSAAQIAADLSLAKVDVTWTARRTPRLLPDHVDGRALFAAATRAVQARAAGRHDAGVGGLGDVVAVPPVRRARDERGLRARPLFDGLTPSGARWDDADEHFDAIIWCTGFRPALAHLRPLALTHHSGHPLTHDPGGLGAAVVSVDDDHVLFAGYGDWCGAASATLAGANTSARAVARHVVAAA